MATDYIKINCGALILCTSTNRYLFLLRSDASYPNTWGIVGGKVEKNETITQGLIREIREELGGEIRGAEIIPIEEFISENKRFTYHTFLIKVEEEFVVPASVFKKEVVSTRFHVAAVVKFPVPELTN